MRLALLFLFALPAHAQHVGPLYALAGDVLVMPPAPVEGPGSVLLAQAVEVHAPPAPAPHVSESDALAARLAAVEVAVANFKQGIGVQPAPAIPSTFWQTKPGIALTIAFTVGTMALSAAGSYATILAAGK